MRGWTSLAMAKFNPCPWLWQFFSIVGKLTFISHLSLNASWILWILRMTYRSRNFITKLTEKQQQTNKDDVYRNEIVNGDWCKAIEWSVCKQSTHIFDLYQTEHEQWAYEFVFLRLFSVSTFLSFLFSAFPFVFIQIMLQMPIDACCLLRFNSIVVYTLVAWPIHLAVAHFQYEVSGMKVSNVHVQCASSNSTSITTM